MALAFSETQKAIMKRLRETSEVTKLLNQSQQNKGIYDYVTEDTKFPYIVVGEPIMSLFEVKNNEVTNLNVTLHIWSTQKGNHEIFLLLSAIQEAFKYKLNIVGYKVIKTSWGDARVFLDIDAIHRHGVFVLKLTLEKEK